MVRLIAVVIVLMAALAVAQGPLRYETRRTEKKGPGCAVSFEYPQITSAASPEARDRMNAGILGILLRRVDWPPSDARAGSLDAYMRNFLDHCEQYRKADGSSRPLYERKTVKVFRATPSVISFRCEVEADSGGAHPCGTTIYLNFDSKTGKAIKLTDILKPDALSRLAALAEARFRKDHKLTATESLSASSFTFPDDRFTLNDNYGIGEKALIFHFNTYEIVPGAMGATDIVIPFTDMRDLLKPGELTYTQPAIR